MVFNTRPDVYLERLNWGAEDNRVFIPVIVNDSFNLVAAWACDPYCEELQDWVELVYDRLNDETVQHPLDTPVKYMSIKDLPHV